MDLSMLERFKEFIGVSDSNEILASVQIAASERFASPFYGYFILSWLIINWRLVYAGIFLDQTLLFEKTGLLRNEYLSALSPLPYSFAFIFFFLIYPFLLTIVILWIFPYGTRPFFRKNIQNKIALKVIELKELRKEKEEETQLKKEETELIKTEIQRAKVEREASKENPEIIWENEYRDLEKNFLFRKLSEVIAAVYQHNGLISDNFETIVQPNVLAFADTRGLISFDGPNRIELTSKGRFFASKFLEKHPIL